MIVRDDGPESRSVEDIPDETGLSYDAKLLKDAKSVNSADREIFDTVQQYREGDQLDPFVPDRSGSRVKQIQQSAVTNLMNLLVEIPAEVLDVAGYRRGGEAPAETESEFPKEFLAWKRERWASKQVTLYETTFAYGSAFVFVDPRADRDNPRIILLPTRHTVAYWRDPVNDARPETVVWLQRRPNSKRDGRVIFVDDYSIREYIWKNNDVLVPDSEAPEYVHGLSDTPVVRYYCRMDDEGKTTGLIGPSIESQNRLNTAVFNADKLGSDSSFKVRTGTGILGEPVIGADGEPVLDPDTGEVVRKPIEISSSTFLSSPDSDARFGAIEETPLDGPLALVNEAYRTFSVRNQLPPHIFLGNLSNLSAEALDAAEATFQRWVRGKLQRQLGDCHMELFRLIAEVIGETAGAESYDGEVRWTDFKLRSFGVYADGLSKLADSLGIPRRGLWKKVPDTSDGDIAQWEALLPAQKEEERQDMMAGIDDAANRENTGAFGTPVNGVAEAPLKTNDTGGNGGTFY